MVADAILGQMILDSLREESEQVRVVQASTLYPCIASASGPASKFLHNEYTEHKFDAILTFLIWIN